MALRNDLLGTEYLTATETAAALTISPRTLWRYQAQGIITPHRLPHGHRRFLRSDVEALIALPTSADGRR